LFIPSKAATSCSSVKESADFSLESCSSKLFKINVDQYIFVDYNPVIATNQIEEFHMKTTDIKAAIARAGTSQAAIASYLGVSTTLVSQVVRGASRSARVEAEIAKICGRNPFPPSRAAHRVKTVWTGKVLPATGGAS
jgi:predicted XRE-type DNA-binding protein